MKDIMLETVFIIASILTFAMLGSIWSLKGFTAFSVIVFVQGVTIVVVTLVIVKNKQQMARTNKEVCK